MGNETISHDRKILRILERRLRHRELQFAQYGISADPSISIEIEDLRKEIRLQQWKIDKTSQDRFEARNKHLSDISAQILESDDSKFVLAGKWKLQEIYGFGKTTGDVTIQQDGSRLSGVMIIEDKMDDGEVVIIQEYFSGTIRETTVFLYGERISTIGGMADDYELDQWIGIIKTENLIEGNSEDLDGTEGRFELRRIT